MNKFLPQKYTYFFFCSTSNHNPVHDSNNCKIKDWNLQSSSEYSIVIPFNLSGLRKAQKFFKSIFLVRVTVGAIAGSRSAHLQMVIEGHGLLGFCGSADAQGLLCSSAHGYGRGKTMERSAYRVCLEQAGMCTYSFAFIG